MEEAFETRLFVLAIKKLDVVEIGADIMETDDVDIKADAAGFDWESEEGAVNVEFMCRAGSASFLRLHIKIAFSNKNISSNLFASLSLSLFTMLDLFDDRLTLLICSWSRFNKRPKRFKSLLPPQPTMNEACITSFKLFTTSSIVSSAWSTKAFSPGEQHFESSLSNSWYLLMRCTGLSKYVSSGSFKPKLSCTDF